MQLGLAVDEAFPELVLVPPHTQVCAAMLVTLTGVYPYAW